MFFFPMIYSVFSHILLWSTNIAMENHHINPYWSLLILINHNFPMIFPWFPMIFTWPSCQRCLVCSAGYRWPLAARPNLAPLTADRWPKVTICYLLIWEDNILSPSVTGQRSAVPGLASLPAVTGTQRCTPGTSDMMVMWISWEIMGKS